MRIPLLTRKLIPESQERLPDGAGGYHAHWVVLGTLWGALEPRSGRETAGAGGALATARYRIVVRGAPSGSPYRPLAGQRFRAGARLFRVVSVTERDSEGRYVECLAEEEVSA